MRASTCIFLCFIKGCTVGGHIEVPYRFPQYALLQLMVGRVTEVFVEDH